MKIRTCTIGSLFFSFFVVVASPAQTFTTLVNFDGANGANPQYSLVQGADGAFYGTTEGGGRYSAGTVFKITPEGALTTLHNFCALNCADGEQPYTSLVQGIDGNFYGTTHAGGACCGTVFKITPLGELTTLHVFCLNQNCSDGSNPSSGLVRATDGNLYGTTSFTIYKITPEGVFTTLHTFSVSEGRIPEGALIQATDGRLYGTTSLGGDVSCNAPTGCGTVFRITLAGTMTTLHAFDGAHGAFPTGLTQGSDGDFYGVTNAYGDLTCDLPFGCGTVFRLSPNGELTTLHVFESADGAFPFGTLIQATDGNLYGTTIVGGDLSCDPSNGCGTVFQMTMGGMLTTLHTFELTDGIFAYGGLIQSTVGSFYGTTFGYFGTIFSLDLGLGPFVAFVRDSGKVGGKGGILGQGFTGTTNVSLDGTPASFTVVSDTFLRATVPAGATTGFVTVTTPSGTLTSNKPFRVTPQLLSFDPPSGPVGTQVTITGVSLTQTQGIGFGDRKPAPFTVNSDTQVTATVPAGAKTGRIGIQTKGGQALSTGAFTVTP